VQPLRPIGCTRAKPLSDAGLRPVAPQPASAVRIGIFPGVISFASALIKPDGAPLKKS
jgi:hypothetical protein